MNAAKIRLSPTEMELVRDAGVILTKNAILQKAMELLAGVQEKQKRILLEHEAMLPPVSIASSPKISKGENYRGLPYLVLDYPRVFDKENIFVIRSMFWWGNFFSITLHLSGQYQSLFAEQVSLGEQVLRENGFFYSSSEDQWQHHFEADNYTSLSEIGPGEFRELNAKRSFIKLAARIPLTNWDQADDLLCEKFALIMEILSG
jgi:hypothetical protein